ncbi:MAG: hypothetical protein KBT47_02825 [Armatimonadetes bacterium]|nr:hypothetical protein [Candidatus Hippobium faecium]
MKLLCIFLTGILMFLIGYKFYGTFLEKKYEIKSDEEMPSKTKRDGKDYVPTKMWVLFGHHFSAIAGAGPIVGPITAALLFGWLPTFLWIVLGCVFIGAMQDFTALVVSVRNSGESLSSVCKKYFSPASYKMYLGFSWLSLVYGLIVLADLTAETFAPNLAGFDAELKQQVVRLGSSVVWSSFLFLIYAVLFGYLTNKKGVSVWKASLVFVPLVLLTGFWGIKLPLIPLSAVPEGKMAYNIIILVYCFFASVLPVWALLQARDYLSSYLLFACMILSVLGLAVSGFMHKTVMSLPYFTGFSSNQGYMFPVLFIIIACGAVSGGHALVASGTTSKQAEKPKDMKPIAYGGMLMEGVLALIALATVMIIGKSTVYDSPNIVFAGGFAVLSETIGIPYEMAISFALLTLSTFLLTSLDCITRIARYFMQEYFGKNDMWHNVLYTLITLILPVIMIWIKIKDPIHPDVIIPVYKIIWPVFGASQQLLAGLCLLLFYVIRKHKNKSTWFIFYPMIFMVVVSITGIIQMLIKNSHNIIIVIFSIFLLFISVFMVYDAIKNNLKNKK